MKKMLLSLALVAVAALWLITATKQLEAGHAQEGRQQLEAAIRRAAVACYAAEGIYPPTLEYMTEYYGLQIQEDRYAVFYEVFADNLMPEITVVEK